MLRKVLIADDSKINREILKKILENDYFILEASDGAEALSVLRENYDDISAVMLDIIMPGMSGFEVLEVMRTEEKIAHIPVLVTTGDSEEASEVKALSLGAKDYILKPYNPEIIKHRLWNTINLRETAAIANMAEKDSLTGLYCRDAFFNKAAKMIAEHEPGYYVMASFNIDNFKVINDQYGTSMGDSVLKGVAQIFQSNFDKMGGICCRVTSDNFALLYPYSYVGSNLLDNIRKKATQPIEIIAPISFSTGRYLITDTSISISAMYDRATMAESYVKGRYDSNIAQYDESMRDDLLKKQSIVNEMQQALREEQFEVWLQPQYNHSTGAVIGAEALVRWRNSQSGKLIPPGDFIPVFERNGFIYEMDKYIWEKCCVLLRKWIDEGSRPLPLSVNVSRYDLFREDFYNVITGLVEKYAIPVELFRIEVTESAFAQSATQIIEIVKKLIDYGFIIEIDDFGSGYSSLNTLKDVPAHIIKLDMRFFEEKSNSSRGGNIVESVVRMAKWLDMSIIAEGVETKEQADYLKTIGSNYVQGFLYAKPMTINQYEHLFACSDKEQKMDSMETVETFDNNDFWNPKSMETLIFNSYIGAACIFEFDRGNVEVLRVNDKFAKVLGFEHLTVEDALKISWENHICRKDRHVILSAINKAIKKRDEVTCEAAFEDLVEGAGKIYLKVSLRVIASIGKRYMFYVILENITAQREAEQKTRKTTNQLQFLNETAHALLEQTDMKAGISNVMNSFLNYFGGDRAYVIEIDYEKRVTNNTFEVCRSGISGRIDMLQDIPLEDSQFWIDSFKHDFFVNNEKIAVPISLNERLVGFIGVDNPSKNMENVDKMAAIGDYIAVMLIRRDLLENLPGGAGIYYAYPDGSLEEVYLNKGYFRLIEASREKRKDNFGFNLLNPIHPEDIQLLLEEVKKGIIENRTINADFRILTGKGEYKWLNVRGDIASRSDERNVLFASYSDIDHMKRFQLSLEASRQAMEVASKTSEIRFWLFDLEKKTVLYEFQDISLTNPVVKRVNIPEDYLGTGEIYSADEALFSELYTKIIGGAHSCETTVRILNQETKKYEWQHIVYTRLDDYMFKSPMAVGFSINADVEQENRLRYEHEMKIRKNMIGDSIAYYQMNLTNEVVEEFYSKFSDVPNICDNSKNRDDLIQDILKNVLPEYHDIVLNSIFPKALLAAHSRGETTVKCTYRRKLKGLGIHWVEAMATIVEKPNSDQVEVFLYVQDIDVSKKNQLAVESLLDEEIDAIAIINAVTGSARFALLKADFVGIEPHQSFHYNAKIKDLIDSKVVEDDVENCKNYLYLKKLKSALDKKLVARLNFKVRNSDGSIFQKKIRAFYLDETHQEIILIERNMTKN